MLAGGTSLERQLWNPAPTRLAALKTSLSTCSSSSRRTRTSAAPAAQPPALARRAPRRRKTRSRNCSSSTPAAARPWNPPQPPQRSNLAYTSRRSDRRRRLRPQPSPRLSRAGIRTSRRTPARRAHRAGCGPAFRAGHALQHPRLRLPRRSPADERGAPQRRVRLRPHHPYAAVAEQLLNAGIDVLIEKPFAASLVEADRVLALAER